MSPARAPRAATLAGLVVCVASCEPFEDAVFEPLRVELGGAPVVLDEGAGSVTLPLSLSRAPDATLTAAYRGVGIEAQDDCPLPDFGVAEGLVSWRAGESVASIDLFVGNDELAEIDERFLLVIEPVDPPSALATTAIEIGIRDDDRTGIVDAFAEFGLTPGLTDDQSSALQAALDRAAELGRGVVTLAPGDYWILETTLGAGTTLAGHGARLRRPADAPVDTITLRADYAGAVDSDATLIDGVSVDGNRDQQGPFRDEERQEAHLVEISADPSQPGRIVASIEGATLSSGTGSGVVLDTGSDTSICRLRASELWRDAVTLLGGGSRLRLRALDATVSEGTTGLWLSGTRQGYLGTRRIDVDIEDARVATGDVEIEAMDGSLVVLRRLTMLEPPFRLLAPDGSVRIADSVLQLGVPSERHNYWGRPHDVEVSGTTLVVSERADERSVAAGDEVAVEADREFAAASVSWPPDAVEPVAPAPHRLLFDRCRFELGTDLEATDTVYAVSSPMLGGSVVVQASGLGAGLLDWFAPECQGCTLSP